MIEKSDLKIVFMVCFLEIKGKMLKFGTLSRNSSPRNRLKFQNYKSCIRLKLWQRIKIQKDVETTLDTKIRNHY